MKQFSIYIQLSHVEKSRAAFDGRRTTQHTRTYAAKRLFEVSAEKDEVLFSFVLSRSKSLWLLIYSRQCACAHLELAKGCFVRCADRTR